MCVFLLRSQKFAYQHNVLPRGVLSMIGNLQKQIYVQTDFRMQMFHRPNEIEQFNDPI